MATETELAWAAGFFDGEGSIGIYRHTLYTQSGTYFTWKVKARLSCCSKEAVARFAEIMGNGVVHLQRRQTKKLREVWSWSVYDRHVIAALEPLLPYLVIKKQQVELGIAFRATVKNHGSRGVPEDVLHRQAEIATAMKAMKLVS